MANDPELLRKFAEDRSQSAFGELVRRHLDLVYFAALRQTESRTLAEDITQKVFCALALKARGLVRRPGLAGWLYTTTHYEAYHALRSERRRQERERQAALMDEWNGNREPTVEWERLRPVIDEILHGMGGRDRDLVLLRFFPGMAFAEIGTQCGLSADAARLRLDRALEKIRAALVKRGIDSTTAALALALASQAEAGAPAKLAAQVVEASLAKAAAAGSTAGALRAFRFMANTKFTVAAAVGLATLTLGVAWREAQAVRDTRAVMEAQMWLADAESAQLTVLRNEIASIQIRREALLAAAKAKPPKRPGMDVENGRAVAAKPAAAVKKKEALADLKIGQDPQIRADFTTYFKALFAHDLGDELSRRGLTAEQQDQYLQLALLRGRISLGGISVELRPDSMSSDDVSQAEATVLGSASAVEAVDESGLNDSFREVTQGLAGNLYTTPEPLSPSQGKQLTALLTTAAANAPTGNTNDIKTIDWAAVLAQAPSFLSVDQVEALKSESELIQAGIFPRWDAAGAIGHEAAPNP